MKNHIPYIDPNFVHARSETMHSLMDGRARWPDGSLRNGRAEPLNREMFAPKAKCEVLESLGVEEGA